MNICLVTDSTSDLPTEIVDHYCIRVVPNIIIIDGISYLDGIEITRQEFYARMRQMKTLPTTATASIGHFQDAYQLLLERGADLIVSIHAASRLTGICNAARKAAEAFPNRVIVLDSGQLSLGLGFQVIAAAKAIAQGLSPEEVISRIEQTRHRVRVFAMLDTLEYVKRSGRISWTQFHLASLLQLRLLIELRDGKVINQGEFRTRKKGIQQLSSILQELGPLENLAILHTNAEQDAMALRDLFHDRSSNPPLICNVTTVIGTHVGPNALGFAAVTQPAADPSDSHLLVQYHP